MVYIFSQLRKGTKTTRQNENVILDVDTTNIVLTSSETGHVI